jgi:hypothetical protein
MNKEPPAAAAAVQGMAVETMHWTAEVRVVVLAVSVVFVAEVVGDGNGFAVMIEEGGPFQLLGHLHLWSGQQLSTKTSYYKNSLLLSTLLL